MDKRNYKIIVSEPWDYKNKNGENVIEGKIIYIVSQNLVIFQSNELLKFNGYTGNIIILKSRYKDDALDIEKNDKCIGIVGGGLYLLNDYEEKSESFLEENSIYILIGSLQKGNVPHVT